MKKIIIILTFGLTISNFIFAQNDADGCTDHPLLTRLENFYISQCENNYNELQLRTSSSKTETKEGNLFYIYYRYNSDAGVKAKSALQIIKNYEIAITKNGGKMIYKNSNSLDANLEATYYLSTKEKEYWVQLTSFAGTDNAIEAFSLNILEMDAMKQEVDATEMFEEINKSGFVALYINFETGKSAIKTESQPIIDQIYEMLKQNPDLKISIEGHTDNVGTTQSNQTLSDARAKSVMNALISKGIIASRLKSKGWGMTKPVADNSTEEGKAKNRRVEIVKQ
ncbi:MAG: OmpA family protein [Bacteroidia bacterium]|jgi:outer membrane protein OmpA-like peptidoglycan-associated protein|nr:OmpA family protein [Bacteroidia bacterium]